MNIECNYSLHFYEHVGRYREALGVTGSSLGEAIDAIEAQHPGFKAILMDPEGRAVSTANGIFLRRSGRPTAPVADLRTALGDGDALIFW